MALRWCVRVVPVVLSMLVVASCAPRGGRQSVDLKKEGRAAAKGEAAPSGQAGGFVETQKFTYYCPAHPEVTQDTPGVCPKDGKFLVAKVAPGTKVQYVCPVHTDVVRDQPGKCPKCQRLLEARTLKTPAG